MSVIRTLNEIVEKFKTLPPEEQEAALGTVRRLLKTPTPPETAPSEPVFEGAEVPCEPGPSPEPAGQSVPEAPNVFVIANPDINVSFVFRNEDAITAKEIWDELEVFNDGGTVTNPYVNMGPTNAHRRPVARAIKGIIALANQVNSRPEHGVRMRAVHHTLPDTQVLVVARGTDESEIFINFKDAVWQKTVDVLDRYCTPHMWPTRGIGPTAWSFTDVSKTGFLYRQLSVVNLESLAQTLDVIGEGTIIQALEGPDRILNYVTTQSRALPMAMSPSVVYRTAYEKMGVDLATFANFIGYSTSSASRFMTTRDIPQGDKYSQHLALFKKNGLLIND